jgi:hypothetical protein
MVEITDVTGTINTLDFYVSKLITDMKIHLVQAPGSIPIEFLRLINNSAQVDGCHFYPSLIIIDYRGNDQSERHNKHSSL